MPTLRWQRDMCHTAQMQMIEECYRNFLLSSIRNMLEDHTLLEMSALELLPCPAFNTMSVRNENENISVLKLDKVGLRWCRDVESWKDGSGKLLYGICLAWEDDKYLTITCNEVGTKSKLKWVLKWYFSFSAWDNMFPSSRIMHPTFLLITSHSFRSIISEWIDLSTYPNTE